MRIDAGLRRALHPPALLLLAVLAWSGSLWVLAAGDEPVWLPVRGRVVAAEERYTVVSFVHPVTRRRTDAYVDGVDAKIRTLVHVETTAADPYLVRLPDSGGTGPLGIFVAALGPALWLVSRGVRVRAVQRLAASDEPEVPMVGVVSAYGRHHLRLDLYQPGATGRPVATLPLLTTGEAPLDVALPVGVKGRPRSTTLARWGERILWPVGTRSFFQRRSVRGPLADGGRPVDEVAEVPPAGRAAIRRNARRRLLLPAGLVLATVTAGLVGTAITLDQAALSRRVERHGVPVEVHVEGIRAKQLRVAFTHPDGGRTVVTTVPVRAGDRYVPNGFYPARADPARPEVVRLDAEPYDARDPLFALWLPAVAALAWLVVAGRTEFVRSRHARSGPWRRVAAVPVPGRRAVALVRPGATAASCLVRIDRLEPGIELLAAGPLEPGSAVALRHGDQLIEVRGRGYGRPGPIYRNGGAPGPA